LNFDFLIDWNLEFEILLEFGAWNLEFSSINEFP